MTTTELALRLRGFINNLEKFNRPFEIAVQTVTQEMANRIFVDGKNSNGTDIGQYDDKKPFYINPSKSAGNTAALIPPKGKSGETVFASGEPHKTTYVESYKEYRKLIGRKNDKVRFILSGDLQSDFRKVSGLESKLAKATKIRVNEFQIKVDGDENAKKLERFNEKYGRITDLTKQERLRLNLIAQKEMLNELTKAGLA